MNRAVRTLILVVDQREGIGIDPDHRPRRAVLPREGLELRARQRDRIIHHFRLAAVEQQGIEPHPLDRQQQLRQRLARPEARRARDRVSVLQRHRHPQIGGAVLEHGEEGCHLADRAERLAHEDIRDRRQEPAEMLHHPARPAHLEFLRLVASEHRRDACRHMDLMRHRIGSVARQLRGQRQQFLRLRLVAVLADMVGHDGIGVGGDDIGAGTDEIIMRVAHHLRRFHQRQRRPFRLPERGTHACQMAAKPTVENDHRLTSFVRASMVGPNALPRQGGVPACDAVNQRRGDRGRPSLIAL